jgi:16S rRNA C967 or C1407 C5-methylase (RsmB/RsmF family)/NOL1/NOP2/fmu family ribosome biogenesis protein
MHIPSSILHDLSRLPQFSESGFVQAQSEDAVVSVRLNPCKPLPVFPGADVVPWCPEGRLLAARPSFTLDPAYHAGAYYVQEASSMFLAWALRQIVSGPHPAMRVLDLCAAPGGKSTLLASLLGPDDLLVSNEVIRGRASILEENLTRWGYANAIVSSNDPRDFSRLSGYFDTIVVDAPCSGSGLFRKDRAALDQWSEHNVALCGQRQERILADVLPALKQGGHLIYSTCSYSVREDEEILDWLLAQQGMETIRLTPPVEWHIRETTSGNGGWGYKFLPGEVRGEGFFLAVLRKVAPSDPVPSVRFRSTSEKALWQHIPWFPHPHDFALLQTQPGVYSFLRAGFEPDLQLLQKHLYLRKAGTRVGEPAHKDWIPAHDAALSIYAQGADVPHMEVGLDEALRFLKKEDFGNDMPPRGWYQVRYQGLGLGWVKSLGNRMNNYLPKHWRIRMELPDELVRE